MTVRIVDDNKREIAKIATTTASLLILCTSVAAAQPQQPSVEYEIGGSTMIFVNTIEQSPIRYLIDPRTENWVNFNQFVNEWKNERGAHPTVREMVSLPSYQKIIGMGKDALPLILGQLKIEGDSPDHWFWALAAISNENPVPPQIRGNISEMAKAWLAWGQEQGYV